MKYSDRISVLNSTIPMGGRMLTSAEVKAIRAAGHRCSESWSVMPAFGSAHHGVCYRPCRTGGRDHAGVYVETK